MRLPNFQRLLLSSFKIDVQRYVSLLVFGGDTIVLKKSYFTKIPQFKSLPISCFENVDKTEKKYYQKKNNSEEHSKNVLCTS